MIKINGIYIGKVCEKDDDIDIIKNWFQKIDQIYFNKEKVIITLNETDKFILKKYFECSQKLKILNFKKNIKIENYNIDSKLSFEYN